MGESWKVTNAHSDEVRTLHSYTERYISVIAYLVWEDLEEEEGSWDDVRSAGDDDDGVQADGVGEVNVLQPHRVRSEVQRTDVTLLQKFFL